MAGIGGALAGVISELATTGSSAVLTRLRAAAPAALLELTRLPGVSKERAQRLHEALGVTDLNELEAAARQGRVREVWGFGPKSEAAILGAIEAYRRRPQAIRLIDARDAAVALADFVAAQPGVTAVDVAGGVRLWDEVIDELVVVGVTDQADESMTDRLGNYPPLARIERRAPDRIVGRLADGVRVRARVTSPARRGPTLIEETGPPAHVEALRRRARERGLNWDTLVAASEQALYAALDLPFLPPETRAWSSLPSAADLSALVTVEDLRGMVHCHTDPPTDAHDRGDGARGRARGIAISPSPITRRPPLRRRPRRRAAAAAVGRDRPHQETVKVRLLRGTESDILADGALDYPDAVLEQLDVVIASIHDRHGWTGRDDRADRARDAHAALQDLGARAGPAACCRAPPIACDVEAVLDAIARSRAAIEINGDPHRLDLEPRWIRAARRRGIRFVISTDAHAIADLDNVEYGVALARRGGVRRDEVLNASPAAEFRAAVHP